MPWDTAFPPSRLMAGTFIMFVPVVGSVAAGESLHRKIDRTIEAKLERDPAPPATDAEFLRRISLDLAGMIPTSAEARTFLDDPSAHKRQALIDRLLGQPRIRAADARGL